MGVTESATVGIYNLAARFSSGGNSALRSPRRGRLCPLAALRPWPISARAGELTSKTPNGMRSCIKKPLNNALRTQLVAGTEAGCRKQKPSGLETAILAFTSSPEALKAGCPGFWPWTSGSLNSRKCAKPPFCPPRLQYHQVITPATKSGHLSPLGFRTTHSPVKRSDPGADHRTICSRVGITQAVCFFVGLAGLHAEREGLRICQ